MPDVLALATLVWKAVQRRPLPFIVMSVAALTLGLVSADRAFGVTPAYYWIVFAVGCVLPPALWWCAWILAHLPHFVGYIESQADPEAIMRTPVATLPERPPLPFDWLAWTAIWFLCLISAVGLSQHPASHTVERVLVEVPATAEPTHTDAVLGATVSPNITPATSRQAPSPHRSATGMQLDESICGENRVSKLEVDLSEPPPADLFYWLVRTVQHDRTSLYPQGPPPVRRAVNPYFEFDVQVPLCDVQYFVAVWECTPAGNDVVGPLARASSTNYLSTISDGCVVIGSFTFTGGQAPGPIALK